MGSGKSTWGARLASSLQYEFIDCDNELERSYLSENGVSLSAGAIYKEVGELHFRQLEADIATTLINRHFVVIATGGGAVENPLTVKALRENGALFYYLQASFDTICRRLESDFSRPLFQDRESARKLYERRLPLYERLKADYVIDTGTDTGIKLPLNNFEGRKKLFVIGDPIKHSLSPVIHSSALKAFSLDEKFTYKRWQVDKDALPKAIWRMREHNSEISGYSVTIPHKVSVMPLIDDIDEVASKIGAVNTVYWRDSKLVGSNTDWLGIKDAISEANLGEVIPKGKAVVFGYGGAGRGAIVALKSLNFHTFILGRDNNKASILSKEFDIEIASFEILKECRIFVNCTPLGLKNESLPEEVLSPLFLSREKVKKMVVFDTVYLSERETPLIKRAKEFGCHTIDGVALLVRQGAYQFPLFTGWDGSVKEIKDVMQSELLRNDR
jgi:shikimate dehydrogenase